ncbi:MAG: AAA family ATPase [Candidatus Aenigmarchaeota archaeon]|nr:AAA family ATPase [Candidatus Aenigmarchaeota archaeon]
MRITTGMINLDDKIEGGFVEGSVNLVVGKTGTGKTTFCCSFMYNGAMNNVPTVYLTTEERVVDIKKDIESMFKWDIDSLEDKGLINFLSLKPMVPSVDMEHTSRLAKSYVSELLRKITESLEKTKAKRLIIDSISVIQLFINDQYLSRIILTSLMDKLREMGITTVISGTITETSGVIAGAELIESTVDSVIKLDFVPVAEDFKRTVTIRKMRRTNHSTLIYPFEITPEGMKLIEVD